MYFAPPLAITVAFCSRRNSLRFCSIAAGAARWRLPALLVVLCATLSTVALATVSSARAADGAIAVTDDGPNRLDLWTTGPKNDVWQRTLTTGSGWSDWSDLGAPTGGATSEPEVIHIPYSSSSSQHGKFFIFVRGANDAMWMKVYSSTTNTWTGWVDQGGSYASGFRASYSGGGDWIDVVGRDKSNNLTWRVMTSGVWGSINTATAGPLSQTPAIIDWTPAGQSPRADVFGIRTDGLIMQTTNQNLAWNPWQGLNGTATSAASGAYGDGRSMVAVRGDNGLTAYVNTNTGGGWQGWTNLGGVLGTAPTIHYWPMPDGRPRWEIIGREPDNTGARSRPPQVVSIEKVGTAGWGAWTGLTPLPDQAFYGVSAQYGNTETGGGDGVIDTDAEIATVIHVIIAATPLVAQTLIDGIRPGAERDRVKDAIAAADIGATVSVTNDGPGRLDLWTNGPGGEVFQRNWTSGAGWSAWLDRGSPTGGMLGAPDVIRTPDGRYHAFAIGIDNALWTRTSDAGTTDSWGTWQSLGGTYSAGVQAAWSDNGNWIDVVTRTTTTNQLVWNHWVSGAGWQPASVRGDGTITGTPSVVDWTHAGSGQTPEMDVFSQGVGNEIFWTTNQSLAWTAWADTNGAATGPVDATAGDNRVLVTTRGADSASLFGNTYQPSHGWEGWVNLGGNLSSGPTAHYWTDADGTPRWDVFGRDGGVLVQSRPGQIVMKDRRGSDSAWGAWAGISSAPGVDYYGASVQFGGGDGIHGTEIDTAVASVRAADSMIADSLLAGMVPTDRDTVQQAAFPESWARGGDDHSVTTPGEISLVLNDFDGTASDTAAVAVLDGLSKDNRDRVTQALHARVQDGYIIRSIATGEVFYYANGVVSYIPSAAFASAAGINLAAAGRTTTAAMAGWTRGPDAAYPTSWRYGGSNHSVEGNEIQQLASVFLLASDDDLGTLMTGLSPADYTTMMAWIGDQSTWDEGSSVDDSDLPDQDVDPGQSTPRSHWSTWFHIVRNWSDATAKTKQRYLEDTAMSQGTAAAVFGITGDAPGALITTLVAAGSQLLAVQISRAREDANGRGVRAEVGMRCANVPLAPDPCWPSYSISPRR
jgi:hypothetical protein